MSHAVGSQQQTLNTTNVNTSGQILNPSQGQSTESFYGTTTSAQDLNQPQATVDALAATLSMFFIIIITIIIIDFLFASHRHICLVVIIIIVVDIIFFCFYYYSFSQSLFSTFTGPLTPKTKWQLC